MGGPLVFLICLLLLLHLPYLSLHISQSCSYDKTAIFNKETACSSIQIEQEKSIHAGSNVCVFVAIGISIVTVLLGVHYYVRHRKADKTIALEKIRAEGETTTRGITNNTAKVETSSQTNSDDYDQTGNPFALCSVLLFMIVKLKSKCDSFKIKADNMEKRLMRLQMENDRMKNELAINQIVEKEEKESADSSTYTFNPDKPIYEICGLQISLRGVDYSKEADISHTFPDGLGHFQRYYIVGRESDLVIMIGDRKLYLHKEILISRIPFFLSLLAQNWIDSSSEIINLSSLHCDFDSSSLSLLLGYSYRGNIFITQDNVQSLIRAAIYLQMESIVEECAKFMERRIRFDEVVPLLNLYKSIGYSKIDKLLYLFDVNFVSISQSIEFLKLSVDDLETILQRDSLNIDDEKQIFEAIDCWIGMSEERKQFGPRLMKFVRYSHLSHEYLKDIVEKTDWVMDNRECYENAKTMSNCNERLCYKATRLIVAIDRTSTQGFCDETNWHLDIYNPLKNKWKRAAIEGQWLHTACVSIGSKIVFVGRRFNSEEEEYEEGTTIIFDAQKNECSEKSGTGRNDSMHYTTIGVIGKQVYSIGGQDDDDSPLPHLYTLDPFVEFPEWTRVSDMNEPRSDAASCTLNGRIYVFGGIDGEFDGAYDDGEVYDPNTDSWNPLAPMGRGRSSSAAAAIDGFIYVVGGKLWRIDGKDEIYADLERYCPEPNTWTKLTPMKIARSSPTVAVSCGTLYVCGGWGENGRFSNSVERYDPTKDEWEEMAPMSGQWRKIVCSVPVPASLPTPLM